jgi:hypothetical protein
MGDLTLVIEDDRRLDGPAMSCLTDQMRTFVLAIMHLAPSAGGRLNVRGAAKAAGYTEGSANNLMRNPRIQAALKEETQKRIGEVGMMSMAALRGIIDNTQHKDHFHAVKLGLALDGFQPAQKVDVTHGGSVDHVVVDNRERIKRIAERLQAQGKDARALLAAGGIIVDAEFEVIESDDEEWTV